MVTKMSNQMAKVERDKLKACMTCPLCNDLFTHATTISECLHTFCKKCIYDKFTEEDLDTCPVCNIGLGCSPLEKLRVDNNLQDLRLKLFASKREKRKSVTPSLASLNRRKKKSLSSITISSPNLAQNVGANAIGSNFNHEKNNDNGTVPLDSHTPPLEEPDKNKKVEDHPKILNSQETLGTVGQNNSMNSAATPSEQSTLKKITDGNDEQFLRMSNLWKSLNCLVEVAKKTTPSKIKRPNSIVLSEPHIARGDVACTDEAKEHQEKSNKTNRPENIITSVVPSDVEGTGDGTKACNEPKENGNENGSPPVPLKPFRRRKFQSVRPKRAAVPEAPQNAAVEANGRAEGEFSPVWFSLIASEHQGTDEPLPQIPSCYLRVKDRNLPVSYVKKYLVKKLSLASEDEVEISLLGQPLLSTLRLNNLLDWWVQTIPAFDRTRTYIGSSAKDFVMVLTYSRKIRL